MSTAEFVQRCHELASQRGANPTAESQPAPETSDADSLIGFFQLFRPGGEDLESLFRGFPHAPHLFERLQQLFAVAGEDRRPQGGRDAYFVVRRPPPLPVELAEHHALNWLRGLRQLAQAAGHDEASQTLGRPLDVRLLEGLPPKPPKQPEDMTELFRVVSKHCGELTAKLPAIDPHAALLRPAYYFIACDAMLRDYLMWPFYAQQTALSDPLRSYFTLWSHGVKFRIFREDCVDVYLPRATAAT
jgi:hypothetical protein